MCTNYTPATPRQLMALGEWAGGVVPDAPWPEETYPGYLAPIVVRNAAVARSPEAWGEIRLARFGLIPRWCRDAAHAATVGRGTYNARTETVPEKASYRQPFAERRWALVPMQNYFEPCWETGRSVRWRIEEAEGALLWAAGLHEQWRDPHSREAVHSFTLLTRNADGHPLLGRMHRPGDEKRQVCTVPQALAGQWLAAPAHDALSWLLRCELPVLRGAPAPVREDPQAALPF